MTLSHQTSCQPVTEIPTHTAFPELIDVWIIQNGAEFYCYHDALPGEQGEYIDTISAPFEFNSDLNRIFVRRWFIEKARSCGLNPIFI